jgi:hypothetical protein
MTMRSLVKLLWKLLLIAIVLAFALYVWPGRYRYDHLSVEGSTYPVRIDRLNGNADMLVPDEGWVPVEGDADSSGTTKDDRTTAAGARI